MSKQRDCRQSVQQLYSKKHNSDDEDLMQEHHQHKMQPLIRKSFTTHAGGYAKTPSTSDRCPTKLSGRSSLYGRR